MNNEIDLELTEVLKSRLKKLTSILYGNGVFKSEESALYLIYPDDEHYLTSLTSYDVAQRLCIISTMGNETIVLILFAKI